MLLCLYCASLHHKSSCCFYARSIPTWYETIPHVPAQLASVEVCSRNINTGLNAGWMRISMCENTRRSSKDQIYMDSRCWWHLISRLSRSHHTTYRFSRHLDSESPGESKRQIRLTDTVFFWKFTACPKEGAARLKNIKGFFYALIFAIP